jgi:ferredoxin
MVVITQNRRKCIGCNYCVELAPGQWRMSKKDGKSVLLGATQKKDQYTLKTADEDAYEANIAAAQACPVNIIQVKEV